MPHAPVNGIEIFYETFGEPDAPTILLVMGLGAQAIAWEQEFCEGLVDRGYHVIRFDNRDVGLSTKFESDLDVGATLMAAFAGEDVDAPYLLTDMAADAAGVLDHAGVDDAHIVGASMGGMIVQTMAIEHGHRVKSMTSIMSTTGDPDVGTPTPEAMSALMGAMMAQVDTRDEVIEQSVQTTKLLAGPEYFDEDRARARAGRSYDRAHYPEGVGRQLIAIAASGSRSEGLKEIDIPTLVIHGTEDPLVTPSGGERTAEVIADAELMVLEGMGHDSPPELWPVFYDAVVKLTTRAEAQ